MYLQWKSQLKDILDLIRVNSDSQFAGIYIYKNENFHSFLESKTDGLSSSYKPDDSVFPKLKANLKNFLSILEGSTYCYTIQSEKKIWGILYLESRTKSASFPNLQNWEICKPILARFIENLAQEKKQVQLFQKEKNNFLSIEKKAEELMVLKDADYYLISLLLTPFQENQNTLSHIRTDFYLEQKNRFRFRKWSAEIGGDVCITHTIKLHDGHEYTLFINSDAMGKSIQGAGGALVLASVMEANILRLRAKNNFNTYPEHCLRSFYLDLQNVFLSFNGSMLTSVVIGLIHSETGFMYYFNAEHPFLILYRDGKSMFLEEGTTIRKIGTPESEKDFHVSMFRLLSYDQIFIGSDGKDDLVMVDENGIEFTQEDENLILRTIEKADGDLEKIIHRIKTISKLRDDISIIRVEFSQKYDTIIYKPLPDPFHKILKLAYEQLEINPDKAIEIIEEIEPEKEKFLEVYKILGKLFFYKNDFLNSMEYFEIYTGLNPSDNLYILSNIYSEFLKLIALIYRVKKEYQIAIESLEEYLYVDPSDNDAIGILSSLYNETNQLTKAADTGERLFLRDKTHKANLANLVEVYVKMKIPGRARMLLELLVKHHPGSEEIPELEKKLFSI